MSGCCSSAMCGFEFPENGNGQILSYANMMLSTNNSEAASIDLKIDENHKELIKIKDNFLINCKNQMPNKMSVIEEIHFPEME